MKVRNTARMIKYLEKKNKHDLVGAEIGVGHGGYAKRLFTRLDIKHLYLVDCYSKYMQKGKEMDLSGEKDAMFENLKDYKDKYTLFEMTSEEAHGLIPDGSLDFVYIDANHQYSHVRDDIKWWSKKVKKGGVVGGHDFLGLGVFLSVLFYALSTFNIHRLRFSMADWWIVRSRLLN